MAEDADESASSLRSKLSDSHAKQVEFAARAVIAEKGLSHVKVEDIPKGTKPEEVEGVAVSLNEQRETAATDALRQMLADKGYEDVDAAIAALDGGSVAPGPDTGAVSRARQVGSVGGPVRTEDLSHITNDGAAQIRWGLENEKPG